jgi:uncharacterized membrane protein
MKLTDFLQGKWLGHPLHPAVVHVPVGAWFIACVLDIVTRTGSQHADGMLLPRLSLYMVAAGLIATLLAVPTGVAEWAGIKKEKPAWKLALYHMLLNAFAAVVWAGNLGLRISTLDTSEPVTAAVLVTSLLGTLLLVGGAYLGKLLVFDHGISVARQSKKKWRAIASSGGSRVPE